MKQTFVLVLVVIALAVVAFERCARIGWFADDFFVGRALHEREAKDASAAALLQDVFTHQWTPQFHVFRPLTLATIAVDWRIHGDDPALHRATNLLVWAAFGITAAWLAHAVARRLQRVDGESVTGLSRGSRALIATAFLLWPAGTEAVGWLVAREDLLCGLFVALWMACLVRFPRLPWLGLPSFALALCAKETAVTAPFLILAIDIWQRGGAEPGARPRYITRHAPTFALLAAYFVVRKVLFGKAGGTYAGRDYFDRLTDPELINRITEGLAQSAWQLITPFNRTALEQDLGTFFATAWIVASAVALTTLVVLGACAKRRARVALLALLPCFILVPLPLLVFVLEGVSSEMDRSRFLVLPMTGFAFVFAAALSRPAAGMRRVATFSIVALALFGTVGWRINLGSYTEATKRVQNVLGDLRTTIPPGQAALLLGVKDPGEAWHPSLMTHEGCHMLSDGIMQALLPPFTNPARLVRVAPADPSDLLLAEAEPAPVLLQLAIREAGAPGFDPIQGSTILPRIPASFQPRPGTPLDRNAMLEVRVELARAAVGTSERFRFVMRGQGPEIAIAEGALRFEGDLAIAEASGRSIEVHRDGRATGVPLNPAVLQLLPSRVLVGWLELRSQGQTTAVTRWVPFDFGPPAAPTR